MGLTPSCPGMGTESRLRQHRDLDPKFLLLFVLKLAEVSCGWSNSRPVTYGLSVFPAVSINRPMALAKVHKVFVKERGGLCICVGCNGSSCVGPSNSLGLWEGVEAPVQGTPGFN